MWAALMFLFPLIGAVCYVHSSRLAIISQIRIRAQLTSLVYRKALALSSRFATKCVQCNACNTCVPSADFGFSQQRLLQAAYLQLGACLMCDVQCPAKCITSGWVHAKWPMQLCRPCMEGDMCGAT